MSNISQAKQEFSELQQLLYSNKDRIQLSNFNKSDIETIKKKSEDFFKNIMSYILMNKSSEFFGVMLLSMEFKIDITKDALFDVDINSSIPYIIFNPFWIKKDDDVNDIVNSIVIELYRIILLHPSMFSELNPYGDDKKHEALNKASDMNIYDIFCNDVNLKLKYNTANNYSFIGLVNNSKIFNNLYSIHKFKQEFNKDIKGNNLFTTYYQKVYENLNSDNNKKNTSISISTCDNLSGNKSHQWYQQNQSNLKQFVSKTLLSNENLWKGRNSMSVAFEDVLEQIHKKPQMIWKQIIESSILSVPYKHKKTRARPNRRQPENYQLRGELPNKKHSIVVAVDVSGSMSFETLNDIISELYSVLQNISNITLNIITFDQEIQSVYEATKASEIKFKITGRGGTSFSPVIEYINSNIKFANSEVIIITDGYGESDIPKPRFNKLIWLLIPNHNGDTYLSVKNMYGMKTKYTPN